MVLESIFGSKATSASSAAASGPSSEREPLLANLGGERPGAAGYGTAGPSQRFVVPKPPRIKTPVRVETKVWLANERTWISWLHVSLLIGSFALALFNSSSFFSHHHPDLPEDPTHPKHPKRNPPLNPGTVRAFALVYAGIAVLTLSWGLGNYLRRVHLIKTRYAGSFDDLIGPPLICAALFIAVLLNFIVRVQEHNLVPAL